jgi:hypothetical protein
MEGEDRLAPEQGCRLHEGETIRPRQSTDDARYVNLRKSPRDVQTIDRKSSVKPAFWRALVVAQERAIPVVAVTDAFLLRRRHSDNVKNGGGNGAAGVIVGQTGIIINTAASDPVCVKADGEFILSTSHNGGDKISGVSLTPEHGPA